MQVAEIIGAAVLSLAALLLGVSKWSRGRKRQRAVDSESAELRRRADVDAERRTSAEAAEDEAAAAEQAEAETVAASEERIREIDEDLERDRAELEAMTDAEVREISDRLAKLYTGKGAP